MNISTRRIVIILLAVNTFVLGLPRPDFGIAQDVANSGKIADRATALARSFSALDKTSLPIQSGVTLLILVRDTITSIASKLSRSGVDLMGTIVTLANDDTGPIVDAFARVTRALTASNALLNGGLSTELNTLTSRLGPYLARQFIDAFRGISGGLQNLSKALASLQVAIEKAKNAAGSGVVTTALVRKFVSPTIVFNVLSALNEIGTGLPAVM
ncbi:uncharacterized protein LOC128723740 [Anopheles nili]|uniref:uncharacterized protein LOC128723740 n=1 Tax=Anopheles nili TaxID=185578 RepID=UPI00237C01F6|nr:uncharacterized protein LOC128723740 [Anopheles nili]